MAVTSADVRVPTSRCTRAFASSTLEPGVQVADDAGHELPFLLVHGVPFAGQCNPVPITCQHGCRGSLIQVKPPV